MKNTILITPLFLLTVLSCKKEQPVQMAVNRVFVYDEGRTAQSAEGTTISIETPAEPITTQANAAGQYTLGISQPGDTVVIAWSKPGHGTYKTQVVSTGASMGINDINLGAPSTVTVNSLSTTTVGDSVRVSIDITSPNTTGEKYVRLIFRKNSAGLSIDERVKFDGGIHLVRNGANTITLPKVALAYGDEKAGDNIYVRAYGDSYYGNIYYTPKEGTVFPNLNRNTCPEASFAW